MRITMLKTKGEVQRYSKLVKAQRYAMTRLQALRYVKERFPQRYAAMSLPDPMKTPDAMKVPGMSGGGQAGTPQQPQHPEHQVGEVMWANGHQYTLNRNHRWERVDKDEPQPRQPAAQQPEVDPRQQQPEAEDDPHKRIADALQASGIASHGDVWHDEKGAYVTTANGKTISIGFASPEQLAQIAAEHSPEYGRSLQAVGQNGRIAGVYRNGQILLAPDATPAELNHELVHAAQDLGLISAAEMKQFGGAENMAYAYQNWLQEGKPENGILQRIFDFFAQLFSGAAKQRQTMRKLDSGEVFSQYNDAYQSSFGVMGFSIDPTKVNYSIAKGYLSQESLGILDTVTRLAKVDMAIQKVLKAEGGKGKTQKNAENINYWLSQKPEMLQQLQEIQKEAHAAGLDAVQLLDPKDPNKIAPYTLEDRQKVWTNVKVAYINPETMRDAPKGDPSGQWQIVEGDVYKDEEGNKYRFKIAGPFADPAEAKLKARDIYLNGLVVDHINKKNFGALARSLPQTYLETLNEDVFEKVRQEITKGVEAAFSERQLSHGDVPTIKMGGRSELRPGGGSIAKRSTVVNPNKMFDKTAGEAGKPHKDYRVNAPIKEAHKTVASFNMSTMCPMFHIGNHGCYLDGCYVTAMGAGANPINMYRKAMYTGELLQLSDEEVATLNKLGGLRMNGMGDLDYTQRYQIKDVLKHAAMRGLQLKCITKQDATFRIVSEALDDLEKGGHALPDITIQPSIDPYYIPITEDDRPGAGAEGFSKGIQKALAAGDTDRAHVLATAAAEVYKSWGRDVKVIDGMLYRKYGFTGKQVSDLMEKHPNLKGRMQPRLVISNGPEAVWAAMNHPGAVVTWMHARIRKGMWSEATNGHLTDYDPSKGISHDSPGNFPGRPVFIPPTEKGGRWNVMIQDERQKKVGETSATKTLVDYIYNNHPQDAERIFQNLKGFSCCQGGTSGDACQDCRVHCATGRGDSPELVTHEDLIKHLEQQKEDRATRKESEMPEPEPDVLSPFLASRVRDSVIRYMRDKHPLFYAKQMAFNFDSPQIPELKSPGVSAPQDPNHPRAPIGGTSVAGEQYTGGQFVPKDKVEEVAAATGKSKEEIASDIQQGQDPALSPPQQPEMEPWQRTKAEHVSGREALIKRFRDLVDQNGGLPKAMSVPEVAAAYDAQARWGDVDMGHRPHVAQAVRDGKPVPPNVLKDYPELASSQQPVVPKSPYQGVLDQAAPYRQQGENYNRNIVAPANRLEHAISVGHGPKMLEYLADELQMRLDALSKPKQPEKPSPPPILTPEQIRERNAAHRRSAAKQQSLLNPKIDAAMEAAPVETPLDADDPREAAAARQKAQDDDYAFARVSMIGNRGEDLKGSARHKVNAWRGLLQAEADGTAAELVNRSSLEKVEPHDYTNIAVHNPIGAIAAYLAMRRFPPKPGASGRHTDDSEETAKKDRQQYVESWMTLKKHLGDIAQVEDDPRQLMVRMREAVAVRINELRGKVPGGKSDYYNNTANGLVPLHNALSQYGTSKSTSILRQLGEFASWMQTTYQDVSPDELAERTQEHALQILEGTSIDKLRGVTKKKGVGGTEFSAAEMYVGKAERQGGSQLPVRTANEAIDYMTDKMRMRGVQFGNSVTDKEREHHGIKSAEAMLDLMDVLGLEADDASIGGKLGFAIGARGHGDALAHYEPSNQVINLTRKNGVGSLAHEWGHFFDHALVDYKSDQYMSRSHEDDYTVTVKKTGYQLTVGSNVLGHYKDKKDYDVEPLPHSEVRAAYAKWKQSRSAFSSRLSKAVHNMVGQGFMSRKKAQYWTSPIEVFARSFERYVQRKLEASGRKNTYLSGVVEGSHTSEDSLWPTDAEVDEMTPAFDAIFAAYAQSDMRKKAKAREQYCKRLSRQLRSVIRYAASSRIPV